MAGDWIKMRGNLWDDPRVLRLCDITDHSEAPVIGALYWLWATADQHTETGIMPGLTLRQIDRKTGIDGFGQALCDIGWLADHPEGVRIVGFEEHNGTSAKRRCTDAQRKANSRNVSASDADNVRTDGGQKAPDDGAREREEKNKCTHTQPLAPGWVLPKAWADWAVSEFPHWTAETVGSISENFRDHWLASGGCSADWQASWQKWCRDDLTQKANRKPREAAPAKSSNSEALKRETAAFNAEQDAHARKLADPEEQARIAAIRERARTSIKVVA